MTKQEKAKKIVAVAEKKYKLAVMSFQNDYIQDANFYLNEVLTSLNDIVFVEDESEFYDEAHQNACKLFNKAILLKKELKRIRVENKKDRIR